MKKLNTLFLANAAAGSSNMMMILMFIIIAAFMYFGMVRPQKKQQQKRMEMMNQLKKGDQVVMVDGLHGKIDSINDQDKTVVLDADGIYLTFSRMAVRQVIPTQAEAVKKQDAAEEKPAAKEANSEKAEAAPSEEKPSDDSKKE